MNTQRLRPSHIPLGLLTVLICLDVVVRILEKVAVLHSARSSHTAFAISLLKQPWWWLALVLGPLQLWVWIRTLARAKLSVAYPFSSLGYPLTMIAAWLVFGEQVGWRTWLGAGLITTGAAIVSRTTVPSGCAESPSHAHRNSASVIAS